MTIERWLSQAEFMAKYGFSFETIRMWRKTGKLQSKKIGHNVVYIRDPEYFEDIPTKGRNQDQIPLFTSAEVGEVMGISAREVRYLTESGRLSCRKIYGWKRYSVLDIRKGIAYRYLRKQLLHGDPRTVRVRKQDIRPAVLAWLEERLLKTLDDPLSI